MRRRLRPRSGWPAPRCAGIRRFAQLPVSLEKPIGDEAGSELADVVPDETMPSPLERASEQLRREDVRLALAALAPRERELLELRFGLSGRDPLTLEEAGKTLGVTRERIRQLETRTLRKLQQLPEAQCLREAG